MGRMLREGQGDTALEVCRTDGKPVDTGHVDGESIDAREVDGKPLTRARSTSNTST